MSGSEPASPHAASAAELKAQIEAEREGRPFLIYRDGDGKHSLHVLVDSKERVTLGRRTSADVPLGWDEEVSRLHAELVRSGDDWTLSDDGLAVDEGAVQRQAVVGERPVVAAPDELRVEPRDLLVPAERYVGRGAPAQRNPTL